MKRPLNIVLFSLLILLSASCRKNYIPDEQQEIFFQMDYINYAWGYQHYGYLIDSRGNILTYDNPERWNFTDGNFNLKAEQMAENINMCRKTGEKIPIRELNKYATFISNIAASKITARRNTGSDNGSLQFICYDFRAKSPSYRGTLIRMEGDYSCENLNFYSKKIVAWMKEISEGLYR